MAVAEEVQANALTVLAQVALTVVEILLVLLLPMVRFVLFGLDVLVHSHQLA
jgi:hypothetical protein